MRTGIRILSIFAFCSLLAGCALRPLTPPKPTLPAIYSCLHFPNAADQAGAVLRTVDQGTKTRLGIDNLVQAFPPDKPTADLGPFINIEEDVSHGVTAKAAVKFFKKLGLAVNLEANATYSISLVAKNNTQYIANDTVRHATLLELYHSEGRIEGAKYFFVKEALGSRDISYQAKANDGISGSATLSAKNASLSANVTVRKGKSKLTSKKQLIICAVLEPFKLSVLHGANGTLHLQATPTMTLLSKSEAQHVLAAAAKIQ